MYVIHNTLVYHTCIYYVEKVCVCLHLYILFLAPKYRVWRVPAWHSPLLPEDMLHRP